MDVINLIIGQGLTTFIIVLVIAYCLIFGWLIMLVDCIKRKFSKKILWLILLILFNIVSAWFYYFFIKRRGAGEEAPKEKKESTVRVEIKNAGEPVEEEKQAAYLQVQNPQEEKVEDGKTLEELQNMAEEHK